MKKPTLPASILLKGLSIKTNVAGQPDQPDHQARGPVTNVSNVPIKPSSGMPKPAAMHWLCRQQHQRARSPTVHRAVRSSYALLPCSYAALPAKA